MKVRELLLEKEVEKYKQAWNSFSHKYDSISEYEVHSGMPVIGQVFQFEDKPLFRAHVFQKRLRRFDPYFISKKYVHPFWHAQHYFMVMEQLYHAGPNKIRDNSKLVGKDIPESFDWKIPIFWRDNISVELILDDLGKHGNYLKEKGDFAFYNDKKNIVVSKMSVITYWQSRSYIRDIEGIKEGDSKALERLIRKIEHQAICHRQMIKPRKTLISSETELIEKLQSGEVPEQELHDFFSFWDPK